MKTRSTFLAVIMAVGLVACDEEVLNPVNPNQLGTETFYKTGPQLVAAINSVYATLQGNNLYNREYFFLHDLLSDDVETGGAQLEAPRAQMLNYVFDASNPLVDANWRGWYRLIHRANLVLENAENATDDITDALRSRIIGEAYFLRGLAFYELSTMWGGVPLMTTSASSPEGLPRSTQAESFAQSLNDLNEAISRLPLASTYTGADVGRASKGTAQAVAAKLLLFQGDYAGAKPYLTEIINSNQYSLVDRYLDNFEEENENNAESIWEIQFSEAFGNAGGWNADGTGIAEVTFRGQEYGPNAWRNLIPNTALVNEFETSPKEDPRMSYNFYRLGDTFNAGESVLDESTVQGDFTKPSWRKYQTIYKRANENTQSGINFRAIRYADVLLMMAEVENELSGPAAALPYLNMTRNRADVQMPEYPTAQYPTGTKEETRLAIMHERRVEMPGEQVRNRDIRRWRRMGYLPNEPIDGYQERYDLLPLPTVELDNNSALSNGDQNPGY
ncbi:RagB/SusD family nutrient uptake outer membrane protein [Algoriphagus halophytocola]|uniref:RagB/SusD family nutrient uptake outer membrane protein n=1 Tax=Algoriphagus halophytocola TaxID=2991499 RepID=A0ABY6MFK7_9BACT|nr:MULTISPECIES: RagB/SusD family nutrient uptake outer membrane protein [unclassified Algoriphagus]UZD21730.1 RagB/SusD family nutrient uptake outer membrane protein [Algoriphagus sp. TR-M5]WBL42942.1 RagB/SusD family nutrient uptake outer membrane protein [Algoriphagus sp. TR-M9]